MDLGTDYVASKCNRLLPRLFVKRLIGYHRSHKHIHARFESRDIDFFAEGPTELKVYRAASRIFTLDRWISEQCEIV